MLRVRSSNIIRRRSSRVILELEVYAGFWGDFLLFC